MQKLLDKLVLFGLCLLALSFTQLQWTAVVVLLVAVAVSSLNSYFENRIPVYLCAAYIAICLFAPEFITFLPLIVYDCAGFGKRYLRICWIAPLLIYLTVCGPRYLAAVALSSGVSLLLQYKTASQLKARDEFFELRDNTKESAMHMERKNRELMEKQDYEVRLATLAERNRIAREIHDNVGHLLTRSILQVGAISVVHARDGKLMEELCCVKNTLSGAMDSIRSSVHDLHDESVDLRLQLGALIEGFQFCPIKLDYDAGELPGELKYCFAAIVREALSNIARHSNASEASVTVAEHPAFCQLIIEDNGTVKTSGDPNGIGLQNMSSRVNAFGGVFRAEHNKGFRIFISVPKGGRV